MEEIYLSLTHDLINSYTPFAQLFIKVIYKIMPNQYLKCLVFLLAISFSTENFAQIEVNP